MGQFWCTFHRTGYTSVSFYRTTSSQYYYFSILPLSIQAITAESAVPSKVSPYVKFKIALKSKEVQRQYPNLLERFLDLGRFEGLDVEQKATKFCDFIKSKTS